MKKQDGLKTTSSSLNDATQPRLPVSARYAPVSQTIRAALSYFAIVLGSGFVLGAFRVPILVPRLGERWAELAEMPIMAAVIFFGAGYILRRFPEVGTRRRSLAAGFLALALSVSAELGLAVLLQHQTLVDFIRSRDKISGSVYLGMLLVFAVMPRMRLPVPAPTTHGSGKP